MTSEPLTDVLAGVTQELAAVLRVEPDRIEPHQLFRALGLDSIRTAELMAALNARFGTGIVADALYDHPTPIALARYVQAETAAVPGHAPRTATSEAGVLDALRRQLAGILRCAPAEIGPGAPFHLLGLDSIRAAEFVAAVNEAYGLTERPVTFYDHPDLAAMAAHIASPAAADRPPAPPSRSEAAPARSAMTRGEVDALLDAVRADMLTVDEAAALLASRSA